MSHVCGEGLNQNKLGVKSTYFISASNKTFSNVTAKI
jgi:hypothetical protein